MNLEETKYTRIEYERRFLVSPKADWKSGIEPYSKTFGDKYLTNTRLRLRILTDSDTGRTLIKLTKKSESESPYFQRISRILLSPVEFRTFDQLDGKRLRKVRYYHNDNGRVFSIDEFQGELSGLILCETEADTLEELMGISFPAFARHEVTADVFFTGGNLCRVGRVELRDKLAVYGMARL